MATRTTRRTAKKEAAESEGTRRGRTSDLEKYKLFSEWAAEEHEVKIDPKQAQFTVLHYKHFQASDVNKEYNASKSEEVAARAAEREERAAERERAREEKAAKATPAKKTSKRTTKKTAAASSAPAKKTASRRTTKKSAASETATEAF